MTLGKKDSYVRINYLILPLAILLIMFLSFLMRTMIMDDAYIALRYADNLLSGEGLVFNPGERIEGIVNTGWVLFIMPFVHILGPVLAVKILGIILVFITLYLLYRISSVFEENQLDIIPILIILLSSTQLDYMLFSFIGMETALMSSLLCIIAWMVLKIDLWSG
jgi:arabinofuranosyltransferase